MPEPNLRAPSISQSAQRCGKAVAHWGPPGHASSGSVARRGWSQHVVVHHAGIFIHLAGAARTAELHHAAVVGRLDDPEAGVLVEDAGGSGSCPALPLASSPQEIHEPPRIMLLAVVTGVEKSS